MSAWVAVAAGLTAACAGIQPTPWKAGDEDAEDMFDEVEELRDR